MWHKIIKIWSSEKKKLQHPRTLRNSRKCVTLPTIHDPLLKHRRDLLGTTEDLWDGWNYAHSSRDTVQDQDEHQQPELTAKGFWRKKQNQATLACGQAQSLLVGRAGWIPERLVSQMIVTSLPHCHFIPLLSVTAPLQPDINSPRYLNFFGHTYPMPGVNMIRDYHCI